MKKRLLSILLTVVMVLSLLPTAAFAVTVDNTYQPGTYVASAPGHDDALVSVTLTLAQQDETVVISDLQADGSTQTPRFWAMVEEAGLLDSIKNANGTTGVDVVSGATQSSRAVLSAVEQALSQATSTISGSGTASDPYQIVTAAQLTAFAAAVDGGNTYAGQYVALGASIDLSGIDSWNPIGTEEGAAVFQGTFDGRGYTISGLTINASVTAGDSYHGLFSVLGSSAVVRNLNLAGADVHVENTSGKAYAGALAGATTKPATSAHSVIGTRIDVCSATGSVSALTSGDALVYAGGMIGFGQIGTAITNCWTDVNVSAVANNTNKNSMAGGIIGSSGNYAVVANCAAFGNVYAASPISTNFGGMAGGLVGMMAGKQYTSYAAGDITIANGGLAKDHHWVGALDGQVTTSGTTGGTAYPAEGAVRSANYYAEDAVLKEEIYENNGATLKNTVTDEPADRGFSTQQGYDKVMVSTAVARPVMASADFAETLNGNIREINGILAAYGITGIALREWQLEGGRVLPTGAVWTSGDISDSIFAGGSGTEGDPYLIATEEQLRDFAASLTSKIDYTGKYVALANDISVSSAAWTPIGGSQYLFNGTFDGRGYTINGLTLGAEDKPFALDNENLYIGLFGILGAKSVVKNVNLTNVAFYTTYAATAYLGGIAGITQGSTTSGDYTGAIIDACSVSGILYLNNTKGNHFVGGLVGMQYKGATINSRVSIRATGIVDGGDLAEVGGLAGLNNRGLIANCWTDNELLYASGNRENGNEGMAVVSNLVACNAGALVNCYASGDLTTREFSTYAGMVSGWVTGIGKSYACWYDLGSTMINGANTDNPVTMNPVAAIGTKVASGVIDSTTTESFCRVGGLAASVLRGAVTNCWTDVDVSGVTDTNNVYAGALYGMDNRVTTVNCYTLGNVTGFSTNPSKVYLGGLAGQGGGIHLNCYSAGDVVSRQVTGDVGILNGRSAGISVQYNSYFNTDALLKQGDTVIAPAKAVGTITTNATEINVVSKTAAELKSEAFAAQLNSNITASSLNAAIDEILKALSGQDGRGFTQQNYYEGNKLLSWTVKNNTVVFGTASTDNTTDGSTGGFTGGTAGKDVKSGNTGDSSNLPLWSALLLASTVTLTGTVLYKRKRAR